MNALLYRIHSKAASAGITVVAVCFLAAGLLGLAGCQQPPTEAMTRSRDALERARTADAERFARDLMDQASKLWQAGQMETARQNGRLAPLRDYAEADSLFGLAAVIAKQAEDSARSRRRRTSNEASALLTQLHRDIVAWREALDGTLTLFRAEKAWSEATMRYDVSARLIDSADYEGGMREMQAARKALQRVSSEVERTEDDRNSKQDMWRTWVRETVDYSRSAHTSAIIVDKLAHTLYLVKDGKLVKSFRCDLGWNSASHKIMAGDGATPEGQYKVSKVVPKGSKYYKALLINYPNERDRKRFADNKARGVISRTAGIGGLIEIHGHGGQDRDWTDGCVALTDTDMDTLMKHVVKGTRVTIVRGSDRWP